MLQTYLAGQVEHYLDFTVILILREESLCIKGVDDWFWVILCLRTPCIIAYWAPIRHGGLCYIHIIPDPENNLIGDKTLFFVWRKQAQWGYFIYIKKKQDFGLLKTFFCLVKLSEFFMYSVCQRYELNVLFSSKAFFFILGILWTVSVFSFTVRSLYPVLKTLPTWRS